MIIYELPGVEQDESEICMEKSQSVKNKDRNTNNEATETSEDEEYSTCIETTDDEQSEAEAAYENTNDNIAKIQRKITRAENRRSTSKKTRDKNKS